MKKFFQQKKIGRETLSEAKGYTIIETMISVSVFLVIIMSGMGALLNANLLHQKSRDMRSIMDNLSFIIEDMSRNLRTGSNYHCIDDGNLTLTNSHSCISGVSGVGISFKSGSSSGLGEQWVYYISNDGKIFRSIGPVASFIQLTSDDIVIDTNASGFSVLGAEPPLLDKQQPFVTIRLVGKISYKGVETPFSLQTSASQRLIDI